jgi:ABC-type lipoprotein export system ATPase subunit
VAAAAPAIEIRGVVKDYRGLRPLRVRELVVAPGQLVTVSGLDATAASVLVDLITGASLPDSGDVLVGGVSTASLSSQEAWLGFLDQFGIVNPRVVLLDQLTVAQNLAVPLTLSVDPLSPGIRARVESLARDVRLASDLLDAAVASIDAAGRLRVRLGRALALAPRIILVEHPTLDLSPYQVDGVAHDLAALVRPDVSLLVLGEDPAVSRVASRALTWDARTGAVQEARGWTRWLGH